VVRRRDEHVRRPETDCQSDLECEPVLWFCSA